MMLDRARRENEPLPDLRVRQPLRDEAQDFDLAGGEASGVGRGRGLYGIETSGKEVRTSEGRFCPERQTGSPCLLERGARFGRAVRGGVKFRECEERQRPLIRGGAGARQGKRSI